MSYEDVKNSRTRQKERAVKAMGGKCSTCGYDKCLSALEFHHLNPEEKEFSISQNTNLAWEQIKDELKKCVLVCSNCHKEIHTELVEAPTESSFNQEIADEISKEIDYIKNGNKIDGEYRCAQCGKVISKGAKLCPECYAKSCRVVQNRPEKDELAKLVAELGFLGVGKMYGVSDNAVRKWCKNDGLPSCKQDIINYVKCL